MTYNEVKTMLDSIGVEYAYYQFSEDTAVPPPFICFYYSGDNDLLADDTNYQKIRHLNVELYTDAKDFTLENTIETTLNQNGLVYRKLESYIDTEKLMMVTWECDMVVTDIITEGE